MDNNDQYVTRKELYSVASYLCVLIFHVAILYNRNSSAQIYVVCCVLGLQIYFLYKLRKIKSIGSAIDL